MLNFPDYRGAIVEAVLNGAQNDSYKEWDKYYDLLNGIITVNDPVTYDGVHITLENPQDVFKKHLLEIVQDWNEEFKPTYLRKKEHQKAD